jgi:hypothetical protein
VYRHRDIRIDELDQLHAHRRIHGHHQQRDARRRDRRAAEVNEHEVDGLPAVAARDLGEFGHEEGVPGDVDAVGGKGGVRGGLGWGGMWGWGGAWGKGREGGGETNR